MGHVKSWWGHIFMAPRNNFFRAIGAASARAPENNICRIFGAKIIIKKFLFIAAIA
ncbi:MAG: hypothetical protein HYV48_02425, partial [Candidatus Omnitrophica bacterium]|nr:hypothetical protein [Candidatus Omnitrophota bacterium]